MKITKSYRLPGMGCTVVHRTTREWGLGASTEPREASVANAKSLVGIAIGAGLWLLSLPGVQDKIRSIVSAGFTRMGGKPGQEPATHIAATKPAQAS